MRFWILGIEVARSLEIDAEEGKYGQIYPQPGPAPVKYPAMQEQICAEAWRLSSFWQVPRSCNVAIYRLEEYLPIGSYGTRNVIEVIE